MSIEAVKGAVIPPFPSKSSRGSSLVAQCDGQLPVCSACLRRQTACTYSEVDRRRGKLKKNETDALQEKVKQLEGIITVLSLGTDDAAHDMLKTMRERPPVQVGGRGLLGADVLADWQRSRQRDVEYDPEVSVLTCTGARAAGSHPGGRANVVTRVALTKSNG